jgi:hypothetical protein
MVVCRRRRSSAPSDGGALLVYLAFSYVRIAHDDEIADFLAAVKVHVELPAGCVGEMELAERLIRANTRKSKLLAVSAEWLKRPFDGPLPRLFHGEKPPPSFLSNA